MNDHSGLTRSIWMEDVQPPTPGHLSQSRAADVCVVGAGISGLTSAYLLARQGVKVLVLDDGPLVSGETERTTAHLSNALDDRYYWLEKMHGLAGARLAAESHTQAINEIERICREEHIDCEFSRLDGYLFNPPDVEVEELEKELAAAHRAGLADVALIDRAPLTSFDTGPALRFHNQAQFHPMKYLKSLIDAIQRLGGELFANTHVLNVKGGGATLVECSNGSKISSGAVVVATNTPVNDRVTMHTKQAAYRTYAMGMRVPAETVTRALYWDTAQDKNELKKGQAGAYHYVRLQRLAGTTDELLIVGGEDHKTGQTDNAEEHWAALESWTRKHFPMALSVAYRWSGQVIEPIDGLAYIGRNPGGASQENIYIVTGDSGHGMTHGTIAGMLLRDLILGRENRWASLYDPSRKTVRAAREFLRENLNVAKKYAELATPGQIQSPEELPCDCGSVLRKGTSKIAVYKDEQGVLHEFSAVCPHLQCIVHWNNAEKSWDCPCHGSRFTRFGEVLNGPAITNLQALAAEEIVR